MGRKRKDVNIYCNVCGRTIHQTTYVQVNRIDFLSGSLLMDKIHVGCLSDEERAKIVEEERIKRELREDNNRHHRHFNISGV